MKIPKTSRRLCEDLSVEIFIFIFLLSCVSFVNCLDTQPRVSGWSGKVSQHTDMYGNWMSDPDTTSGVGYINSTYTLGYCQKFYPSTTNWGYYKHENISCWKNAGGGGCFYPDGFSAVFYCSDGTLNITQSITTKNSITTEGSTTQAQVTNSTTNSIFVTSSSITTNQFSTTKDEISLLTTINQANNFSSEDKSKISIIIGSVIGALFLLGCSALLLSFIILRRKKQKKDNTTTTINNNVEIDKSTTAYTSIGLGIVSLPHNSKTNSYTPIESSSSSSHEIKYSDLIFEDKIGEGSFGEVYKGKWRNQSVAIKRSINENAVSLESFMSETKLMMRIRVHENVVLFMGICKNPTCIVLKYYENGCLLNFLRSNHKLPWSLQLKLMKGVAAGMSHLHQEKIIHRDLAARNILLSSSMDAVVSDFGFARMLQEDNVGSTVSNIGPIRHMAPECLLNRLYSEKSDVWAFGVVCYEILTRKEPYHGLDNINTVAQVCMGLRLQLPEQINDRALVHLLKACWSSNPFERPTIQQCYDVISGLHN